MVRALSARIPKSFTEEIVLVNDRLFCVEAHCVAIHPQERLVKASHPGAFPARRR
jgi:hypothetical protein